jgi:large subunit ribosomal protein L31e
LKVNEEEEVWIDPAVNEHIWTRGIENPPRKVKLQITRHDEPDIPIEVKLLEE